MKPSGNYQALSFLLLSLVLRLVFPFQLHRSRPIYPQNLRAENYLRFSFVARHSSSSEETFLPGPSNETSKSDSPDTQKNETSLSFSNKTTLESTVDVGKTEGQKSQELSADHAFRNQSDVAVPSKRQLPSFWPFRRNITKEGFSPEKNAKAKEMTGTNAQSSSSNIPLSNATLVATGVKMKSSSGLPGIQSKLRIIPLLGRLVQFVVLAGAALVIGPIISGEMGDFMQSRVRSYGTRPPELARSIPPDRTPVEPIEDGSARVPSENDETSTEQETSVSPQSTIPQRPPSEKLSVDERRFMACSFVTEAVRKIGPSVVRIDTETHLLQEEQGVTTPRTPAFVQQGQGSGLIFTPDGFILTNAHVVEDATKVTVTLTDGRVYQAEVKGADEIVDIAVLKIIPESNSAFDSSSANLPVAELGDSDKLDVGQMVIAVGSPGGLDNTVTMGIVSGLQRSSTMVGIPHKKVDYIQTDAAINPGNSGGPLVNVETGKVIGINAAIRAHMEGTSFAIPINRVREIMKDLAAGRPVHHGYLGISLATCTPEWARQNNARAAPASPIIPEVNGALVHKVFPRTPAEAGGLRDNDVILEIEGQKIRTSDDARRLIDSAPVGKVSTTNCENMPDEMYW